MDTEEYLATGVCAGTVPAPSEESMLLASPEERYAGSVGPSVLAESPVTASVDKGNYIDSHVHLDKLHMQIRCQYLNKTFSIAPSEVNLNGTRKWM